MVTRLATTVLIGICLSSLSIAEEESSLTDLIQPILLESGKSDTVFVSDIFYARKYDLVIRSNPSVNVQYLRNSNQLVFTPHNNFVGYTTVEFELNQNAGYVIPILCTKKQTHTFYFKPDKKPEQRLNVMGNFDGWNRNSNAMHDDDGDGIYTVEVPLDPGQYLYQFVFDDQEFYDPKNTEKMDNGFGGFNSVFDVPPEYTDEVFLHAINYKHENDSLKLNLLYEKDGNPESLRKDNVLVLHNNRLVNNHAITVKQNKIQIVLNSDTKFKGESFIRVAVTKAGRSSNLQTICLQDGIPASGEEFVSWHDAVIYSIMVDRFVDGDPTNTRPVMHDSLFNKANYQGGDFAGIIAKIEDGYFKRLGVNTLWISPVNENTNEAFREWPPPHRYFTAYHGYWPTHHQRLEERFGSAVQFRKLVQTAHAHDLKVILDFIANHTHQDHPFFKNHRDWFGTYELPDGRKNMRLWDEFRLTTWFEPFLPSFDYINSQAALDAMTDNAIWWLREFNLDGFRHDAVKHVPNNFWRTLTHKIREQVENPEHHLLQIGETFGSYDLIKSYVNNGQLNSQFNFNLYDVALPVFLNENGDFATLANEIDKTIKIYGTQNLMGNVMSSHDKIRYMAYADNDIVLNSSDAAETGWRDPPIVNYKSSYKKALLYYAYMFGIPGIPVVYYGDEFGMTGAADPDNRRMMRFGSELSSNEAEMLKKTSELIHLRRKYSALRYGDYRTMLANQSVFVFLRSDVNNRVLIAINKTEKSQDIAIELPSFYKTNVASDLFTKQPKTIKDDKLTFQLKPLSYKYFVIENQGS